MPNSKTVTERPVERAPYNPVMQLSPGVLEDTLNASDIMLRILSVSGQTELLVVREKTGRGRVWMMYCDLNMGFREMPRHAVHFDDIEHAEHAIRGIQSAVGTAKIDTVIGLSGMFFKVRDVRLVCNVLIKWVDEEKSRPRILVVDK